MKNYISTVFKNVINKDCLITLVTNKVNASIIIKELAIGFSENKIFIYEKDELTGFEIDYGAFDVEDLSVSDGVDMTIRISDGEYIDITSLID